MPIVTCGLDTAKHIFHFHGLTCDGEVKRKTLKRRELLTFFAKLDVCLVGMDDRVSQSDRSIKAVFDQCKASQRLASLPGIGGRWAYIGDVSQFRNGRELSAYPGLVPRQHASGGKTVLLAISKWGNGYLRTLPVHGARSVLRHLKGKEDAHSLWLARVSGRRGHNKACGAQANKTARRVWALLSQATSYQVAA